MMERGNTLRAIHPARPHTVGYTGVCDQGGDQMTQNAMSEGDTWSTSFPACRAQSAAKRMQRLSTIALWRHPAWRASASRLAVERIWLTYNIQDQNLGRVN